MRIAIDVRELQGKPTGVGRYLREILRAWNDMPGAAGHQYVFCSPDGHRDHSLPNLQIEYACKPTPANGALWEQIALPRLAASADVLFAPGYSGPVLSRVPLVVTIHDVSFAAHPEWFSMREGLRRRTATRLSARRAAKIITVSDFSKNEITRHLGVPSSRVDVIYSGLTPVASWAPPAVPSLDNDVILYVGSLFNRRHIPELIDGFTRLAGHHPRARLEIVGDNRTRPHIDVDAAVARSSAASRIRVRAYVSDEELASLYARARAFAFLSEYEGFALTPLEALGAGIPPVLLDTDVAREIYGPAALYVERLDPDLIATALEHALFDATERSRVLSAAAAQMQRYSWRECAQRTLQVLTSCARHKDHKDGFATKITEIHKG